MKHNLSWTVKIENFNGRKICDFNIFDIEFNNIKKTKKNSATKEEFADKIKTILMSMFWSRCQWELLIKKKNNRIILTSLFDNIAKISLDVTDDTSFDWLSFYEKHVKEQVFRDYAKIDVFDQLMFRWNDFIDYCWNTHFPYERKKK